MELYEKAESERLSGTERCKRRKLRITQVRQQTADWMSKSREDYKLEKDRQIKLLSDTLTDDIQSQAAERIKFYTESHNLATSEIGSAHVAAASLPNFQSMMAKQKLLDDEVAQRRYAVAVKHKRSVTGSMNIKANKIISRKAQVRFEEDVKARELVEKLPFGLRNMESDFHKESGKRQISEYQQSLAKSLYVPPKPSDKENKTSCRKRSIEAIKDEHPPKIKPGAFAKIAEVREAGATTPDISAAHIISARNFKSTKPKQIPDVIYFDAAIPRPPQKYRPPSGLVERVPLKLSEPSAWTGAKQINQETLKLKLRKSLEDIEKRKVTEQRGRTALKIAKLEQEFKQLEVAFTKGKELESWRPTMTSPSKISLVGLDDSLNTTFESDYSLKSESDIVDQRPFTLSASSIRGSLHLKDEDTSVGRPYEGSQSHNLEPGMSDQTLSAFAGSSIHGISYSQNPNYGTTIGRPIKGIQRRKSESVMTDLRTSRVSGPHIRRSLYSEVKNYETEIKELDDSRHSRKSESDTVYQRQIVVESPVCKSLQFDIENYDTTIEKPYFASNDELKQKLDNVIRSLKKSRPGPSIIQKPAIVLLEGPTRVTPDKIIRFDTEDEAEKPGPMLSIKDMVTLSPLRSPLMPQLRHPKLPISIPETEFSSENTSSSKFSIRSPTFSTDFHKIDSTSSSILSSEESNIRKKFRAENDSHSSFERKYEIKSSHQSSSNQYTASSYLSSSSVISTPERISRVKILHSEVSSMSSSIGTEGTGTDYFSPPNKSASKLRNRTPEHSFGPSTSTPEYQKRKLPTISQSLIVKYMTKLLSRRPESIESFSSPSSINSYVVLNTSATISSFSTPSSQTKSSSNSSNNRTPSYHQIDNLSCSYIQTPHQISETTVHKDKTDPTVSSVSSSSTDAVVAIKVLSNDLSTSTSQSNTDESLAGALSALCFRQEKALGVVSSSEHEIEDSTSVQYYSTGEQNTSTTESSGNLFYPPKKIEEGSGKPDRYTYQSSGSGDLASKESYRAGDPCTTIISRPSPDVENYLENNPFQQLTNEWANISIERPPWF